jgi:hypothetical protein
MNPNNTETTIDNLTTEITRNKQSFFLVYQIYINGKIEWRYETNDDQAFSFTADAVASTLPEEHPIFLKVNKN